MGILLTIFLTDLFVRIHKIEHDNWDSQRFSDDDHLKNKFDLGRAVSWMSFLIQNQDDFEEAFHMYEDEYSRKLMLILLEYAVLGHHHVRLPVNNSEYWKSRNQIDEKYLIKKNEIRYGNRMLNLYEHKQSGIRFYGTLLGFLTTYIQKQYSLSRFPFIRPELGDVCIDGGSCRGEGSLHFSLAVGRKGQVHAFEFVPRNLRVFKKNLKLNPKFSKNIRLVSKALWNVSGEKLNYVDAGPGTKVFGKQAKTGKAKVEAITIDDYVREAGLKKVDFIKMDIEGAEVPALEGAKKTIQKFKPKLAISAYHKMDDFFSIPRVLRKILPDYKFYLDHYTIYNEETVLYATV